MYSLNDVITVLESFLKNAFPVLSSHLLFSPYSPSLSSPLLYSPVLPSSSLLSSTILFSHLTCPPYSSPQFSTLHPTLLLSLSSSIKFSVKTKLKHLSYYSFWKPNINETNNYRFSTIMIYSIINFTLRSLNTEYIVCDITWMTRVTNRSN